MPKSITTRELNWQTQSEIDVKKIIQTKTNNEIILSPEEMENQRFHDLHSRKLSFDQDSAQHSFFLV